MKGQRIIERPWDRYREYARDEPYTVWIVEMKSGQAGCLQSHDNFDELWIMLTNCGQVQVSEQVRDVQQAVCSTSHDRAVNLVVERLLGPQSKARFTAIPAGDGVSKKKPDPEIYNLACRKLGLSPSECVVVEDSHNDLLVSKAASMYYIVTTNGYTKEEDFNDADLAVSELGDEPNVRATFQQIKHIVEDH